MTGERPAPVRPSMGLCAFLSIAGYVEGAWRLPESDPRCNTDIDYFVGLARTAEVAGFDAVFVADGLALWADVRRRPTGTFEPSILAASILSRTTDIGVIITLSTSFGAPYDVARTLASLDHLSNGRIGWNIVTSSSDDAARNFGLDRLPDHRARYARAEEFVEVCLKLWQSWDEDAIQADKQGHWARGQSVAPIDHEGPNFKVKGPLDIPRSPQVVPLLLQAGTSPDGLALAASVADATFTVENDRERSAAHIAALQQLAADAGRSGRIAVLPGFLPVFGDDPADARRRLSELESLMDVALAVEELELRFGWPKGTLDPDAPLPGALPPIDAENGNQSLYSVLHRLAGDEGRTVGEIVRIMNAGRGHLTAFGTAQEIAETMIQWFEAGAADGFNVICLTLPNTLERFATEVVPILRDRGYLGRGTGTLRARFDAPFPRPPRA